MESMTLPTNIEAGDYPKAWPLAKATYEAINASYGIAKDKSDKITQLQLFGQWALLRNEFNNIAKEGFKQCIGCGGFGHVYQSPCPTAKQITAIKQTAQFRTIIEAGEGALERENGIAKSAAK
jgi:hypothetical protein